MTYVPNRFRRILAAQAPPRVATVPGKPAKKRKATRKPSDPLPPGSLTAEALTLFLPVPVMDLRPNAGHGHWSAIHKARAKAKSLAQLLTRSLAGPEPSLLPTGYSLVFHTHNRWDDDNAVASVKSYLDGIAAALGINDRTLKSRGVTHHPDRKCPRVEIVMHLAASLAP
jgi:crossover junction endodeoxyribonuclease RusA